MTIERDKKGRFIKGGTKNPKSYIWKKGEKQHKKANKKGLTKKNNKSVLKQSKTLSKTWKKQLKEGRITTFIKGHKINLGRFKSKETRKKISEKRLFQIMPIKDTSIEIKIQNLLNKLKIKFEKHKIINNIKHKYQCDIFIKPNIVIECDGNYWHNYPDYRKIDKLRTSEMIKQQYKVLRLWECEINNNIKFCKNKIKTIIQK